MSKKPKKNSGAQKPPGGGGRASGPGLLPAAAIIDPISGEVMGRAQEGPEWGTEAFRRQQSVVAGWDDDEDVREAERVGREEVDSLTRPTKLRTLTRHGRSTSMLG